MLIGEAEKDPRLLSEYAGSTICAPPLTRTAYAAASPDPLSVNRAGVTAAIWRLDADSTPAGLLKISCAFPLAMPAGTMKLTCQGVTNRRGAAHDLPAESIIETDVPPQLVGAGPIISPGVPTASPGPAIDASEPGARPITLGLAADKISGTFGMGVEPAAGASATPRNTSPAAALFSVVNCSFAATAGSRFVRTSLMATSLFGSAP